MSHPYVAQGKQRQHPDTPIYPVMPVKYLLDEVANQTLSMRRMIGWEDTHAGFSRIRFCSQASQDGC
jgi:hypothetical protein